jgi:DNA primase
VLFGDNDDAGRRHLAKQAQSLGKIGITPRIAQMDGLPEGGDVRDWLKTHTAEELAQLIRDTIPAPDSAEAPMPDSDDLQDDADDCPYQVINGRMFYLKKAKSFLKRPNQELEMLADFTAEVTGEQLNEDGSKVFVVDGKTVNGQPFRLDMAAQTFADERQLKALLTEAAGADAPIYAGMHRHLFMRACTATSRRPFKSSRTLRPFVAPGAISVPDGQVTIFWFLDENPRDLNRPAS